MARQIKDYRSLRISAKSALVPEVVYATAPISPETVEMPQSPTSFDKTHSGEQFVDYEPVENRDLFFMLQSLFENPAHLCLRSFGEGKLGRNRKIARER
jgi:hypothetical protein